VGSTLPSSGPFPNNGVQLVPSQYFRKRRTIEIRSPSPAPIKAVNLNNPAPALTGPWPLHLGVVGLRPGVHSDSHDLRPNQSSARPPWVSGTDHTTSSPRFRLRAKRFQRINPHFGQIRAKPTGMGTVRIIPCRRIWSSPGQGLDHQSLTPWSKSLRQRDQYLPPYTTKGP